MSKKPPKVQRPTNARKEEVEGVPDQVVAKIKELTPAQSTGIVVCANSFRFGGNWGFLHEESKDFEAFAQNLASERGSVRLSRIKNGGLIEIKESFLATTVNQIIPNAIDADFVKMSKERRASEKAKFDKFVKSVVEGKSRHIVKHNGYSEIVLGIFSINETNLIRVGGKDYPAYKLSLIEALEFARQLEGEGLEVYAKAVKPDGTELFDRVFNLASNTNGQRALYAGLEIADSETGIFLTLRIKPVAR